MIDLGGGYYSGVWLYWVGYMHGYDMIYDG